MPCGTPTSRDPENFILIYVLDVQFFYGRYLKRLSNRTQEAVGEMTKVASESLSALRTVQAFNALPQEEQKFTDRVNAILSLARKEAVASGIFFGSTGWSGNVTLLCLLGYGMANDDIAVRKLIRSLSYRRKSRIAGSHLSRRLDKPSPLHRLRRRRASDALVRPTVTSYSYTPYNLYFPALGRSL